MRSPAVHPRPELIIISAVFAFAIGLITTGLGAANTGNPIFADDFSNRTEPGPAYSAAKEWPDSWKITNGVLVGKQGNPNHGAVIKKDLDFHNLDIAFDFRFNGGTQFNFVIDDKAEKSVHAGHICRVSVTPRKLTIGDDKTGKMNLKVQALRADKNLSPDKKQDLEKLLAGAESTGQLDLKPATWHRLHVRIDGDTMEASVDGNRIAILRSPGINHPTKTSFGFTVNGSTIDFDNIEVSSDIR